jgi:hypothetical protein
MAYCLHCYQLKSLVCKKRILNMYLERRVIISAMTLLLFINIRIILSADITAKTTISVYGLKSIGGPQSVAESLKDQKKIEPRQTKNVIQKSTHECGKKDEKNTKKRKGKAISIGAIIIFSLLGYIILSYQVDNS